MLLLLLLLMEPHSSIVLFASINMMVIANSGTVNLRVDSILLVQLTHIGTASPSLV